jgi:O-antigen ligase
VASDPSERQRIDAIRQGTTVFAQHMPWGVGSGQYDVYDPAHTASHSLLIQILVEDGMLGAAGLVVVCVFVLREFARLLRRNSDSLDSAALRWACFLGAGSFLLQGLLAGAPFAIGSVAVWASLLWLLLALGSIKNSEAGLA